MVFVRLFLLSTLLLLLTAGNLTAKSLTSVPYKQALETAVSENKQIYLYFHSPQCPWCRTMENKTHGDGKVAAYLEENFISVSINMDTNPALARKYRVSGVPANIFLSPQGETLFSRPGHVPPQTFIRILEILHTGKHDK
ncbi:thioredoxin-related protein [Desulfobotulus alkaliphilus]|uniref:Thioredoxin-related protein n=1 Tax=Desulfobotulus alkaliphilus TaxID=622671 RepID=A0A562RFG3_9BACT|nr:thioredoxin fold domain-containing protein [Desulfobotulus alkaliphilus]TWI67815.1 thioredoxin-related protein [Desulfobotulus alkaliphilus]